ncbi:hypothetical protein CC2G_013727 [Coprinopsis cinerea AmutBmut pab1-1]|nr:hypothetical protein CC2G_013727 [Coprinopsis cinerea AmutBmut pab1-1]
MVRQLLLPVLAVALAAREALAVIPVGGLCVGIAGPVKDTCVEGSVCCNVSPDRSLCTIVPKGGKCPDRFIEEGGFCAGIAGPVRDGTCIAGTSCCYVYPDLGLCLSPERCGKPGFPKPIEPKSD